LGNQHVLALRTNGTVLAWGYNANGQGSVPAGISGVLAIAAGGNHNLVLTARPIIESISAPVAGTLGGAVTFNVTASGAPLGYQWKHRGTDLPGETNASLTINPVEVGNGGEYSVVVTNPHGSATASTAIIFPPPGITAQPQDLTVRRGERVSFNVGASGLGPFAYQWFRNGSAISNATSSAYEAVVLEAGDSGIFTVVVTDAAGGRTTSREARLTVVDPRVQMAAVRPALDTSISSGGANPRGAATILAGGRGNGTRDRGLLRFDLTAIPTNATVRGALLKLTVVMSPPGPAASTFYLHRALKNWDAAATWQNAIAGTLWSAPGGGENVDYEAAGAPGVVEPGGVVHAFAFTNETAAVFGDWIHEPAANHGWMLISDRESAGKTARHFGSSESAKPPELTVYYSEPPRPAVLRDVSIQTNRLVFQLTGEPGWLYEIQTRAEVNSGAWISLTNRPAGAALEPVVFEAPLSGARQFFRVLVN
jgi:hypothetical protein